MCVTVCVCVYVHAHLRVCVYVHVFPPPQLFAADEDAGSNGEVVYRILAGDLGHFVINQTYAPTSLKSAIFKPYIDFIGLHLVI